MTIDRRSFIVASEGGVAEMGAGIILAPSAGTKNSVSKTVLRNEGFSKLPISINLPSVTDWEPGLPFLDLFSGTLQLITGHQSSGGLQNAEAHTAFHYKDDVVPLQVPVTIR